MGLVAALVAVVLLWVDRDDASPGASAPTSSASGPLDADALLGAGDDAEAAARDAVVRMTTYDWRTVDADFTWVDDAGTEAFKTYFAGASRDAKAVIASLRATATGTVVDSASTVIDPSHVKVLLFVDQEITARGQEGTKIDQPRVTMQMVLVDGAWLVDQVAVNDLLTG